MDYEGLIDDNRVLISLIACSMNYETAVTFTYGHFNKVVFAVNTWPPSLFCYPLPPFYISNTVDREISR